MHTHTNSCLLQNILSLDSYIVSTLKEYMTPLYCAAKVGHLDCLNALVEARAKVDAGDRVRLNIITARAKLLYVYMHASVKYAYVFVDINRFRPQSTSYCPTFTMID